MPMPKGTTLVLAILVLSGCGTSTSMRLPIPHCESSALLPAPCLAGAGPCFWLADNEMPDALYRLDLQKESSPQAERVQLRDEQGRALEIGDIEALAALPGEQVLILGSMGHKSDCKWPAKRRRLAVLDPKQGQAWQASWPDPWNCRDALSTSVSALSSDFCTQVEAAAQLARDRRQATPPAEDCKDLQTLNLEGAASDPAGRVWLGARAPLVPRPGVGGAAADAVLLRLDGLEALSGGLRFDGLQLLDLDGRGIRELAATGDWLWIIAGPALDSLAPFVLYRLAWNELDPDAGRRPLRPQRLGELPTSSEGLAFHGGDAWVAMDGDQDQVEACAAHSHLLRKRMAPD